MNTGSKILIGITAAALAGVGIGMLIAPNSGSESRKKLKKNTNDVANRLLQIVRSNGESFKDAAEEVADDVKSKYRQAKGKVEEVVDDVKAGYNQAKGYAQAEMNHNEEKAKAARP